MDDSPNEKAPNRIAVGASIDSFRAYLAEKVGAKNLYKSMTFCRNVMIYAMIGGRLGYESLCGRLHPAQADLRPHKNKSAYFLSKSSGFDSMGAINLRIMNSKCSM